MSLTLEQKVAIVEWLASSNRGVTAMEGARVVHDDWHKVSDYLEELIWIGVAKYASGMVDGLHKYELVR